MTYDELKRSNRKAAEAFLEVANLKPLSEMKFSVSKRDKLTFRDIYDVLYVYDPSVEQWFCEESFSRR